MKLTFLLLSHLLVSTALFGQNSIALNQTLSDLYEKQSFEDVVKLEGQIHSQILNVKDTATANCFSLLAESHYQLGELEQAITWYEREKTLRLALNLTKTDAYSGVLYSLANTYLELGVYEKAGVVATALIENDRKLYSIASEDYVASAISASAIYVQLDRFNDAEKILQHAIKHQHAGSLLQGVLQTKLGDLYTLTSQFTKASRELNASLASLEIDPGKNSNEYISALIALGNLHMAQGKFGDAEEVFDYTLAELTTEDDAYVPVLNNQAIVYKSLGQLDRSEKILKQIQEMDSIAIGTDHNDYAITLSNLGLVLTNEEKFKEAENVLLRAIEIQKKKNETKSSSYAPKLINLALLYRSSGKPEKAIPLLEEAMLITKTKLGNKSAEYATAAFNLGMANWKAGKGPVGLKLLKTSATIRAEKLGKNHPKYAESLQKIAEYQWEQKQLKEAKISFNEVFNNYYFQIDKSFPVLTEEEKAKFYYNNIKPSFEKFNSFAMESRATDPTVIGEIYNHHINTKAAIMYATEKVKQSIRKSNDTTLIREFEIWRAQKEQIAKLYSQNKPSNKIDSLQQSADKLEKEITRRSSVFANQINRKRLTWQEIQKKLNPSEAAVEVVRFKKYIPTNGGDFTQEITYAFLIVTPESKLQPDVVFVSNGKELENKYLNFYRNNIKFTLDDNRSYKLFFEALANHLNKIGVKKFYFSPDGVYNQISINTVKNPVTQKYFLDEFEVSLVTNSRELIERRLTKQNSQSSLLIGYPKFNLQAREPAVATEAATRSLTKEGNLNRSLRGGLLRQLRGEGGISVLPGTEIEINQIAKITPAPEIFMEDLAAEGLIKQVISPMILHVATHGYFLEGDDAAMNPAEGKSTFVPSPLLQSGLLLAGSEDFLKFGTPANDDGDDGILTAYEAMNLNLEDTELVVLSACETGLGVVKNGEGVYGLQRAFKMAGAKTMIMSLWQVDDAATQQLMSSFYEEKLKSNDIHAAFRIAQQKLKEKYPHPFYWGAFIMVGI